MSAHCADAARLRETIAELLDPPAFETQTTSIHASPSIRAGIGCCDGAVVP
jgi:hypothetical protein